jgi:hypothetical protein
MVIYQKLKQFRHLPVVLGDKSLSSSEDIVNIDNHYQPLIIIYINIGFYN